MRKSIYRRHNQVFLELLRRYREQGKFRQRDLAQHLGSVQGTVSKAETGTRRLDVIELREWLLAMGVDFLEFMTQLHQQLQAVNALDPWSMGRMTLPSLESEPPSIHQDTGTRQAEQPIAGPSRLLEQAALLEELDRAQQEHQPDSGRLQARRQYFEVHADALALLLVPAMRTALAREAADTLAELDNLQLQGRPLSRWVRHLASRHGADAESLLSPGDAEVKSCAQELAQLLLSNWFGLLTHATREQASEMMEALRGNPPILPTEVTTGCRAYPVPEVQAISVLAMYLLEHWTPDLLNQWQTYWNKD